MLYYFVGKTNDTNLLWWIMSDSANPKFVFRSDFDNIPGQARIESQTEGTRLSGNLVLDELSFENDLEYWKFFSLLKQVEHGGGLITIIEHRNCPQPRLAPFLSVITGTLIEARITHSHAMTLTWKETFSGNTINTLIGFLRCQPKVSGNVAQLIQPERFARTGAGIIVTGYTLVFDFPVKL